MKGTPKLKYLQRLPHLRTQAGSFDLGHAHYGYCGWLARSQTRAPVVVSFMGSDLLGTSDGNGGRGPAKRRPAEPAEEGALASHGSREGRRDLRERNEGPEE